MSIQGTEPLVGYRSTHHTILTAWHTIWKYINGVDILTFYLTFFLAYALTFYLTFYVASILTFYLAFYLTFYLAFLLTFYLAFSIGMSSVQAHSTASWAVWSSSDPGRAHCIAGEEKEAEKAKEVEQEEEKEKELHLYCYNYRETYGFGTWELWNHVIPALSF